MYRKFFLTFCLSVLGITAQCADLPATLDDVITLLNKTMTKSDVIQKERQQKIDSIANALATAKDGRMQIAEQLGREYRYFNVDSALAVYTRGIEEAVAAGDSVMAQRMRILRAGVLVVVGAPVEGEQEFDAVGSGRIFDENRRLFVKTGHDIFFYMSSAYPLKEGRIRYANRGLEYCKQMLEITPEDDPWRKYYEAEKAFMEGRMALVSALSTEIIEQEPIDSHLFALASSMMSDYYNGTSGKEDEKLYYLALSAVSDVMSGNREESALHRVGSEFFKRGDLESAYKCLSLSLENANNCSARARTLDAAESLSIISDAYRVKDQQKINVMTWLLLTLLLAVGLLIYMLMSHNREIKRINALTERLNEANALKESFIGEFIGLCSVYMDKTEEYTRMASRKIKAGQIEDLYEIVKTGKLLEELHVMFDSIFDTAFVKIYPSFVDDVNKLLQPDKRFKLREGEVLNTELRILAFMRLGMDDTSQIATFLDLSVNTIYTYRNKLKSKALNRDTFEESVMKIARYHQ